METQETYRLMFEHMLAGFALHEIICDASGKPTDYRFLSVNPAFERMTGLRAADVIGRTVMEVLPETEPVWIERYGRVALTGEAVQFEEYSRGQNKHFQVTAFCPQPGWFAVVFDDITAHKVAEARILRLTQLYAALSQTNQAIVRSVSPEELLPTICRIAVEFGGMTMAWIGRVEEATGKVHKVAAFGSGTGYLEDIEISLDAEDPLGLGPTGTAIREGRPVWCQDFQNDPSIAPWHERGEAFGWRSSAAIPLRVEGKAIGSLTLYSGIPHAFDEEARNLLVEMAGDISFGWESFLRKDARARAEEELQNLRTAVEQSANTVVITDTNGRIEYVNPAFETSTGYSTAEALGNNPRVLKSGEQDPAFYRDLWKTITSGETWRGEFHNRRKDGSLYWESATISPVHNGTGEIVHFIAVKEDITARKDAEAALVMSEARFRTIIEKSPVPMAGNDKELNITFLNPAFVRLFGYSHEEIPTVSHWWPKAYPSPDYRQQVTDGWQAELERARRTGTTFSPMEVTVRCKNGADKTVLISATPLSGSPDDDHVVVVIDITDRKILESNLLDALNLAEAGNRAKSEFLAIMSHELRTPLNGVLGFAELLADTPLNNEQSEFARTISSSGNHLLHIVNDILDFSSIEKGSMKFEAVPVAVAEIVESSCIPLRKTAIDKGLKFRCELDPLLPNEIIGDSHRICQILINLIANAVKFTAAGSVVLRVSPASTDGCACLDFSVRDTGIGMSLETISQLFRPFTQADSKMNRRFEGTGLGLAISQRLAEAMGGKITVVSTPGEGSTFTFRLPQDSSTGRIYPGAGWTTTEAADGFTGSDGSLVLVVEDDPNNGRLAGKMLEALGF
ncbi:MAG: PAS domain S-box protein, partial [Verrucomicrobiota bacterium]